ncbi:MAG: N-acetylmuramoyl-L-alanine amidase [Actinobacteria bacterium]|nr:N-acetylmuramoyl-L-alanine amidase [Actinomycetota bacterium]
MATRLVRRLGMSVLAAAVPLAASIPAVGTEPPAGPAGASHYYGQPVEYPMLFPVGGDDLFFADDDTIGFGACRAGCTRLHEGVDVLAPKMTEVYAVADGTVSWIGSRCCSVFIQHDDGWMSWYIHLNNDTPGTDDGLGWGIADGVVAGARVSAGQLIGWVGDSGNAEDTDPHLHFELHDAYGVIVDPYPALLLAQLGGPGVCARSGAVPLGELIDGEVLLRKGMRGVAVHELQGFLATRGYPVGAIDGIFGDLTERALRGFQRSQGLDDDGLVGTATRAAIGTFIERAAFASLLDLDGRVLEQGMRGPDVRELKRWLRAVGYEVGPRPLTRAFDPVLQAAVVTFQESAGLPADGRVDVATRSALQHALWLVAPDPCG